MTELLHFSGVISTVTPDGRSGIVTLNSEVDGKMRAVISPITNGRIGLMNGKGALSKGTRVQGDAVQGPDALKAVKVELVD